MVQSWRFLEACMEAFWVPSFDATKQEQRQSRSRCRCRGAEEWGLAAGWLVDLRRIRWRLLEGVSPGTLTGRNREDGQGCLYHLHY